MNTTSRNIKDKILEWLVMVIGIVIAVICVLLVLSVIYYGFKIGSAFVNRTPMPWVETQYNADGVACQWAEIGSDWREEKGWDCPLTQAELDAPVERWKLDELVASEKYREVLADDTESARMRSYIDALKGDGDLTLQEYQNLHERLSAANSRIVERERRALIQNLGVVSDTSDN